MVVITWEYLLGRVIATDYSNRKMVEWPPHPERVFQALIAAWGERGESVNEKKALEWLEKLPPPILAVPPKIESGEAVSCYVPANDLDASKNEIKSNSYGDSRLKLLPSQRKRSERSFPSFHIGDDPCYLIWMNDETAQFHEQLQDLCSSVQRIGHSSSFVNCRLLKELPEIPERYDIYEPVTASISAGDKSLRVPEKGRLEILIKNHYDSLNRIPPQYQPPPVARQKLYKKQRKKEIHHCGDFDPAFIVFRIVEGNKYGLKQTALITGAMRSLFLPKAAKTGKQTLELFSGHDEEGKPLKKAHLSFIPLPFVGNKYADGHLIGMGIVLPKGLTSEEENRIYKTIANTLDGNYEAVLTFGKDGIIKIRYEDNLSVQKTLQVESWVSGSDVWRSVTPLMLDRMGKKKKDLETWTRQQVIEACSYQGLPSPIVVRTNQISFLSGSPPCFDFPPIPLGNGGRRWMVHIEIHFSEKVYGPLLLGAGRYKGYGLFKPVFPHISREISS